MRVGYRIFSDYPKTDKTLLDRLRFIPVSNIDDVMGRIYSTGSGIRRMGKMNISGAACTVKVPYGDNLAMHRALDICRPGDILVVDGGGMTERSLCGEQMFRYAMKKGIAGFVVDGAIRDADSLDELGFPVFAKSVSANGPYKFGPGEVNVPISVGGIVVFPGDFLIGDGDGLVVIRPFDAAQIADAARALQNMEIEKFKALESGVPNKKWVMEKLLQDGFSLSDECYRA